jgi:putative tryptophan/tyrosine transport system substrate-binding protein
MKRREFMTLLGGALTWSIFWPLAARAQQADRMRRIGVLMGDAEDDSETKTRLAAFRQGLERLGWSEGRNVRIDYRFAADNPDAFGPLAKQLVSVQPDVLLAYATPAAAAFQRETRTIPIVFVSVSDPVGSGLVASLARPGGNLTGMLLYEEGITGKWLAMLKEIAPGLSRAALIADPRRTPYDYFVRSAKSVALSLAIELAPSPVGNAADIERVIESFARKPDGGLVLLPGTPIEHRDLFIALAARHRLPAVYYYRYFVTAGGLMSYGTDLVDQYRDAATYVDRILRGTNPTELPVQAPTKYVTTVNLKTAKALGLAVPPTLLVRADEVIE